MNELEYFQLFIIDEILELLTEESNNYMKKMLLDKYGTDYKAIILKSNNYGTYADLYVKRGINKEDILAYIGIRIYMGLYKYSSIEEYWKDGLLHESMLKKIMPRAYFQMISTSLHFPEKINDNNEITESEDNKNFDPRIKILEFLKILVKNFQKHYILGNRITIDESLLHFTGKNKMKFYIPMKPHKWGFKLHLLCDADTSYVYNILFYPGKNNKEYFDFEDYSRPLGEKIGLKLLETIDDNK